MGEHLGLMVWTGLNKMNIMWRRRGKELTEEALKEMNKLKRCLGKVIHGSEAS